MKTHLIAGLAALTLLGACASAAAAPAVSSNISMSDLDRKELKQWNKAEKDIRKGEKLIAEGNKDLEKGEEMVRKAIPYAPPCLLLGRDFQIRRDPRDGHARLIGMPLVSMTSEDVIP